MFRKKKAAQAAAIDDTPEDFLHTTAGKVGPILHSAADVLGPLAVSAADRVSPLYTSAAGRVTPLYTTSAGRVQPLYTTVAGRLTPLAVSAAGVIGPYAASAKQRGAQAAQEAVELLGPRLEDALDRVSPAVESARDRVSDELLPRLSEALGAAAAAPVVAEATKRGKATLAAARGDLALPEPEAEKKRGWVKWLTVLLALAGAGAVAARKFLGSQDADWQAARPSAPYAPPTATASASTSDPDAVVVDDSPNLASGAAGMGGPTASTSATGESGVHGGQELGLGEDVEVGEHATPPEERDILPSDPITVLADKKDGDENAT